MPEAPPRPQAAERGFNSNSGNVLPVFATCTPSPTQFVGEGASLGERVRAPHTRATSSVPSRRTISLLIVMKSSSESTGTRFAVGIGSSSCTQETQPS